jgi:hypothetical protein
MKKILLAVALSCTAALGGCITAGDLASNVSQVEQQVQADANLVCGFIPTVATIAAFIPGAGTVAPEAASIAQSICAAIAAAPPVQVQSARLRSSKLRAAGNRTAVNVATAYVPGVGPVPITGEFTR